MLRKRKMNKIKQKYLLSTIASAYKLDNSKCLPAVSYPTGTLKSLFQTELIFLQTCSSFHVFWLGHELRLSKHLYILVVSVPHPVPPKPRQFKLLKEYLSNLSLLHPHPPGHPLAQSFILGLNYSHTCQSGLPVSSLALPPTNFQRDLAKVHKSDYIARQDIPPMDKFQIADLDLVHPSSHFSLTYNHPYSVPKPHPSACSSTGGSPRLRAFLDASTST